MTFNLNVSNIHLTNGTSINVPSDGALVIVGPNNSGKTVFIQEISQQISIDPRQSPLAVRDIDLQRTGDATEVVRWFEECVSEERTYPESGGKFFKGVSGELITRTHIETIWPQQKRLGGLGSYLVSTQGASSRLQLITDSNLHDFYDDVPSHILQALFMSPDMESRLTRWVREAFGFDVCVNRYGHELKLLIGKHPDPLPSPPPPPAVIKHYYSLKRVSDEGDGVKAFIGLLLHVMLSPRKIVIIDEPEAFLHPPQARRLGRLLLEEAPQDRQLIVATHSQDFLQGILEARNRQVKIIRTTRTGDKFRVQIVQPNLIKRAWLDPLLRYSNFLNGLFHTGVILCEGDSDCRFYQAVIDDSLAKEQEPLDLLYTHVNGKARISKGLRQMRDFHVKSAAIVDFDVLNERNTFKSIVEAANGHWEDYKDDFNEIEAAVFAMGRTIKTVGTVRNDLRALLEGYSGGQSMADRLRDEIKTALGPRSQWDVLKKGGIAVLEGPAIEATRRVLDRLKEIGVFVVPVGVLERWIPLGVKKQNWLAKVFEEDLHLTASPNLHQFLSEVLAYITR